MISHDDRRRILETERRLVESGVILDADHDLAVRTGLQCAPLAHEAMGTAPEGTVRVSLGPFNTEEHIDRLIAGLVELTA